jgi:ATP-binding cassette, subfamily F, member 3
MKIEFERGEQSGREVIRLDELNVGYGESVLVDGIQQVVRYGQRLCLVGPNGCGKTTLLRTIAGQIPALAGQVRLGSNVRLGFMTQEQENLAPGENALELLRHSFHGSETELRSFLSKFLFKGDEVYVLAGSMSYGERARLSLAAQVAQGCNLLLLDEPLNHLDIPARLKFEQALKGFEGTILAVVHDRYFIQSFSTAIWEIREGQVAVMLG